MKLFRCMMKSRNPVSEARAGCNASCGESGFRIVEAGGFDGIFLCVTLPGKPDASEPVLGFCFGMKQIRRSA